MIVEGFQGPYPVSDIGWGHCNSMRQSLSIDYDVSFDSRNLLSCVVPFMPSSVCIAHALGINDTEARFGVTPLSDTGLADLIFLKPAPAGWAYLPLEAHSIAENRHAPFSTWESHWESSATGSHFSAGRGRHKIRRKGPSSGVWSSFLHWPVSEASLEIARG